MIRDEISELNDWLNGLVQTSEYMLSENELGSDNWWRDYFNAVGADIPGRRGVIECRFFLRAAKKALLEEAYLLALPRDHPERTGEQIEVLRELARESVSMAWRAKAKVLEKITDLRYLNPLKKRPRRRTKKQIDMEDARPRHHNRQWLMDTQKLRLDNPQMTIPEAGRKAGRSGLDEAIESAYRRALKSNPDLADRTR